VPSPQKNHLGGKVCHPLFRRKDSGPRGQSKAITREILVRLRRSIDVQKLAGIQQRQRRIDQCRGSGRIDTFRQPGRQNKLVALSASGGDFTMLSG
jgi:hypothetical protein